MQANHQLQKNCKLVHEKWNGSMRTWKSTKLSIQLDVLAVVGPRTSRGYLKLLTDMQWKEYSAGA